jgi:Domain of unknown function (DUF1330)
MAACVISEVEVLDEESFEQYRSRAQTSIELHGRRYLVRAALPEAAEGNWSPQGKARHRRVPQHGHAAAVVFLGGLRASVRLPGPGAEPTPVVRRGSVR